MDPSEAIGLPDHVEDPHRYRAALLAVVGERDPLEVIARTPARARSLIQNHDRRTLDWRPAAGEWSAAEIIGHLLDDEIVNAFRLRLTLTAERPAYAGNDPVQWAALPKPPIDVLLPTWEGLRTYNVWLLRSLPRAEWGRVGLHAEQGPETVEILILKNAGHDLAHLDQLARRLAGERPSPPRRAPD